MPRLCVGVCSLCWHLSSQGGEQDFSSAAMQPLPPTPPLDVDASEQFSAGKALIKVDISGCPVAARAGHRQRSTVGAAGNGRLRRQCGGVAAWRCQPVCRGGGHAFVGRCVLLPRPGDGHKAPYYPPRPLGVVTSGPTRAAAAEREALGLRHFCERSLRRAPPYTAPQASARHSRRDEAPGPCLG